MNRIESASNQRYKRWRKLKDKKFRTKEGRLLVEGPVVIREVAETGHVEEVLIDEKVEEDISLYEELDCPVTLLDHKLFLELAATEHSQGIIAVCTSFLKEADQLPRRGRYLYTDGLQDPGNLGGMIRSAEAFSFDGILIGDNTVDVTNPKCIRASMASAFRVPIAKVDDRALDGFHSNCTFYALDINGDELDGKSRFDRDLVLVVGNEAHGIRPSILRRVDHTLRIPMKETIDSLNANVATSIAMFLIEGGER